MGHRSGLLDSRVALDGMTIDIDGGADVDTLELDEQSLVLPFGGNVQRLAIPGLATPASLASGGIEVGVLLVVAVRNAHFLPLRVIECGV